MMAFCLLPAMFIGAVGARVIGEARYCCYFAFRFRFAAFSYAFVGFATVRAICRHAIFFWLCFYFHPCRCRPPLITSLRPLPTPLRADSLPFSRPIFAAAFFRRRQIASFHCLRRVPSAHASPPAIRQTLTPEIKMLDDVFALMKVAFACFSHPFFRPYATIITICLRHVMLLLRCFSS